MGATIWAGRVIPQIIANDFVGFNADQLIVDISGSDKAFSTDSDCGTWFQTPRRPAQSTITLGTWLVGNQIAPGIYRANVQSGCYWERLRSFGGQLGEVLANDFIKTQPDHKSSK